MTGEDNLFEPINASVYRQLYDGIIHLEYEPGQKLVESQLAAELKVSRSPIKSAIERLEEEKLVIRETGKSPCVMPIQYKDCAYLVEARKGIESMAAFYAAQRITDGELAELRHTLLQFKQGDAPLSPELFAKADARFHRIIVNASKSPYLISAYARIEGNLLRYRLYIMRRLDLAALREYENHIPLYQAMKQHSPVLAREEMLTAIDNMYPALRVL